MSNRKKVLAVGAGVAVVVVFLTLGLLPAHLDLSRTVTDFKQTGTSSNWNGAVPRTEARVEVQADPGLADRVREAFARQGTFTVGTAGSVDTVPARLRLQVQDATTWWTPFWADSRLVVQVTFASDGDLSDLHDHKRPRPGEPLSAVTKGQARFAFHSRAFGLVSRSAYLDRLAAEIATDTSKHFRTAMGW